MYQKPALKLALTVAAVLTAGCGALWPGGGNEPRSPASIVDGSFIVPPRTFRSFAFAVTKDMEEPRVEGTFLAEGANDDIEVLLFEESEFLNWQNRNRFAAAYQSGRVTSQKIRVALPAEPATYHIVFSNRFSIFSNKGVNANVQLRFDR